MSNFARGAVLAMMASHEELERQLAEAKETVETQARLIEAQARAVAGYVEQAAFAERVRSVMSLTNNDVTGQLVQKVRSQETTIAIYRRAFTDHEALVLRLRKATEE